ncbi:MAG: OsmC family protein [Phycisphaerae bacterium]
MAKYSKTRVLNGVDLQTLRETVEAVRDEPELGNSKFRVSNRWLEGNHNRSTVGRFYTGRQEHEHKQPYTFEADEPPVLAGADSAPNPVEHLLNALAACMTTSMVAHAAVRGIEIEELESTVEGDIDLQGFLGLDPDCPKGYRNIRVSFRVKTAEENLPKLQELAEYSPVFNTITHGANIEVDVRGK